jgi:hypothetical protein
VCNALAAVVAAAGTVLLEPLLHARGAAVATLAAEATLAAGYLIALRRRRSALAPNLAVVPKVMAAAGIGALAALLPVHPVIATLVGGGAYLAAAFALRAVPPEVVQALIHRGPLSS